MNFITKKLVIFVWFSGFFAGNSFAMDVKKMIEECKSLYNQLRIAQGQKEPGAEVKKVFSYSKFRTLFDEALKTGLQGKYMEMLKASSGDKKLLLDEIISSRNLPWIAYYQNKYSINGNPFTYLSTIKTMVNGPMLGWYVFPNKKEQEPITCYAVLQGLFDVMDNMTALELSNKNINENISDLKFKLGRALAGAQGLGITAQSEAILGECGICFEEKLVVPIPCKNKHTDLICDECLSKIKKSNNVCPICREPLK